MSSVERRSTAESKQLADVVLRGRPRLRPALQDSEPCITILLCTYNGARFLAAQLASIERQTHRNWRLVVSDDHSCDATMAIIRHFAQRVPQPVEIRMGPGDGPCANFMSLAADTKVDGDYFAFCDQDDIWHRDKLSRALMWARSVDANIPAVYGGRTHIVCAGGHYLGNSPLFSRAPSFANALVQSIAGANTMLFNCAAKRLFETSGPLDVVSHDWWAYQLVTGCGGVVHYDPKPHLDYRQHPDNRIGSNRGLRAQWKRLRQVLNGGFVAWNDINSVALRRCRHLLTAEARVLLDTFDVMRHGDLVSRLRVLLRSPLRRQTHLGNFALLVATVLRKV